MLHLAVGHHPKWANLVEETLDGVMENMKKACQKVALGRVLTIQQTYKSG